MKRISMLGVALVAVLAMSAVAASAAFAQPEFKGEGGSSAAGTTFKGTAGAGELAGTQNVTCTGGSSEGEISSGTEVSKVVVKFTGCKSGSTACKSKGAASGEIKTVALKGKLGDIEGGSGVGLLLEPASGTEYTNIETCTLLKATVTGKVIGEVKPISTLGTTGELVYEHSGTTQKYETFSGAGEKDHLSAFGSSAIGVINTIEFSKAIEVS